jgi:hypothetical protein
MNVPTLPRVPPTARRVVPIVVPIVVFALGLLFFVQPPLSAAFRATAESGPLESRADSLRRLIASAKDVADEHAAVMAEFERRVPAEDRTPEIVELLARLALDPPDTTRARGLVIDTAPRVNPDEKPASGGPQLGGPQAQTISLDPRWGLFPVGLMYTPITVSFECSYDRLGLFLWRLRDLPTLVEVRGLEVTRALPLLKVRLVIFALQRTGRAPASPAAASPAGTGPRVASAGLDAAFSMLAASLTKAAGPDGATPWP